MSDLAAFLAARLDEDEAVARRAASESPWSVSDTNDDGTRDVNPAEAPDGLWHGEVALHIAGNDATHIARHDPARVLREAEAGRALLAAYIKAEAALPRGQRDDWEDSAVACAHGKVDGLRAAVAIRAAVYSGHPGYDPAWAPG